MGGPVGGGVLGGSPAGDRLVAGEAGDGGGRIHPEKLPRMKAFVPVSVRVGDWPINGYLGPWREAAA